MSRQLPINGKYGVVDFAATYRKVLIAVSWQELSADQLRETAHFFNQLAEIIDGDKPTTIDTRPANCRNRLQSEGKPHPRSGCNVLGCKGVFGAICKNERETNN